MRWVRLNRIYFPAFIKFVITHEWKSVSLSSRLLNPDMSIKHPSFITETLYCLHNEKTQQVQGVFMLTSSGLLLPLFEDNLQWTEIPGIEEIRRKLRKKGKVFCILGHEPDVCAALSFLDLPVDTEEKYNLLELPLPETPEKPQGCGTRVKRAGPEDAERLFPLEEKYTRDEVLIHKDTFHRKATLQNLKKNCTLQILLYTEKNGIPAAKANTNAIGINYAQIGGVFTDYSFRRRGYSMLVMKCLLYEITTMKKKSLLFVKKTNLSANNLYRKLGFKKRGDYRITYIKH